MDIYHTVPDIQWKKTLKLFQGLLPSKAILRASTAVW